MDSAKPVNQPLMPKFAPIPDFPDYLIGRNGQVISLLTGTFLAPWRRASGHLMLALTDAFGQKRKMQVHRLVLMTFIGPAPEGMEACHRDGNPNNNTLTNLRWAPRSENIQDYRRLNGKHWRARITLQQANLIRSEYTGRRGQQAFLAEKYGVSRDVVNDIINGKTYLGVTP